MGGIDHSRQEENRTRAGVDAQDASNMGYRAKSPLGRVTVAADATDGGWEKPLAVTVSTTAFLRHLMGSGPVFSSGDARLRKCLNPQL